MSDQKHNKLEGVRREYLRDQLDESGLPADPFVLLLRWMEEATGSGIPDPTAMTLSTVDKEGSPSSRIVLLKKINTQDLVFFTNLNSRKSSQISHNPKVAAHLFWPQLERQVKIAGTAARLDDAGSESYFSSRPFESQVSAWASPQSEVVPDRDYLEQEYRKYLEKFGESGVVPRPPHWGGIRIKPGRMEFWQGGRHRLHDRIEYSLDERGWSFVRLAP
jgi:pyridoxamine 5'-phosphate oxidase